MKKYDKFIWIIFVIQLVVIAVVLMTAKVDDMTLAKGKMSQFHTGWVLVREDNSQTNLDKLPYNISYLAKYVIYNLNTHVAITHITVVNKAPYVVSLLLTSDIAAIVYINFILKYIITNVNVTVVTKVLLMDIA